MQIKFSKSQKDIFTECDKMLEQSKVLFEQRKDIPKKLLDAPSRDKCVLCLSAVTDRFKEFSHRDILFITCSVCGHIQSKAKPPQGYPSVPFDTVYPELSAQEYASRVERIYKPKLSWIFDSLNRLDLTKEELISKSWIDLGSGAGYFLKSLKDEGVKELKGSDSNNQLVDISNKALGSTVADCTLDSLSEVVQNSSTDVYTAFFVLEHLEDVSIFLNALKSKPKGTVFVFAVPVFGLSCLLEGIFKNHFARNLDGIIHTQMYTDKSIEYAMKIAGYEITNEWIFGQDAADLIRVMYSDIKESNPEVEMEELKNKLSEMIDPMQEAIDKNNLADQRHVIAIKR